MKLVILTGMSGAGKSTALKMMEDIGFYCVDNLPIPLIEKFIELADLRNTELQKVAVGVDIRSGQALEDLQDILDHLRGEGKEFDVLFLDAEDGVLVKRYKETRRSHPLAGSDRVDKGIEEERRRLEFLKNLFITILSFGFKYGIPADADLVFDVRFLPNPYYVEGLRQKNGNDKEIQDFVMQYKEAHVFLDKLEDMIKFLIPNYITEGKSQLVIAIGCTGGKHRSVTLANELFKRLEKQKQFGIKIEHRDIEKDTMRH